MENTTAHCIRSMLSQRNLY